MSKIGKSSAVNGGKTISILDSSSNKVIFLVLLDSDRILRHPFKYDSQVPEIPFHRYIIDKMSRYNDRIAIVN